METREAPADFSLAGVGRGFARAGSLAAGAGVFGMAFGLVARQVQLGAAEAALMSASVYSGSAQLAVTELARVAGGWAKVSFWTAAAAILVVNARYLLFGAALSPWLKRVPGRTAYASLFFLGDGNWLLSMNAYRAGERDGGFVLGSGLAMFLAWLAGTLIGVVAGDLAPDPRRLGLDWLLVCFAAAMAVGMVRQRTDLLLLVLGAGVALGSAQVIPDGWAFVLAGVATGLFAFLRGSAAA